MMLGAQVCNDKRLRPRHRISVKHTVAPRRSQRTQLWTRNTKMKIATVTANGMKRIWIPFHCSTRMYAAAHNAWLDSAAAIPSNKCRREDFRAQGLPIRNVTDKFIWHPHVKSAMKLISQMLMTQNQLCLPTSAMRLEYISRILWALIGTTTYRPNS